MEIKKIAHNFLFWLLLAFIAGFGFNEIATRLSLNPLRSSAFMDASYGGINSSECISFYQDTANCWRNSFNQQMFDGYGGGGGYGGGEYNPPAPNTNSNSNSNSNTNTGTNAPPSNCVYGINPNGGCNPGYNTTPTPTPTPPQPTPQPTDPGCPAWQQVNGVCWWPF